MMEVVAGIDVGGTNTDAVLVSEGRVVAWAKVPTTPDIRGGIVDALDKVAGTHRIKRVHIGTTAFTNALVERRELAPAAAIRVGKPVSESLPPMSDWPDDLRSVARNPIFFVNGGREFDGRAIGALDREEIAEVARNVASSNISQVAVTSVFGTSYPEDEIRIAEWIREANPELEVSLAHRIGRFGILERENATLLNAMLRPLAARTIAAYREAVPANLLISQNDGTVLRSTSAAELPIFTVASGPTNSLRGAAILGALADAIVFDVGGTTTDAGVLRGSYPQPAGLDLSIAGVRTNFRMPDLCSIGIGGGSLIDASTGAVGPKSVGYRLTEEALAFGGSTLTLTDIALAAGRIEIGDRSRVKHLDSELITRVDSHLRTRLARLLENYERIGQQLPIILVGGGASLIEDLLRELGRVVMRPPHASVANAYGAAMAQVGGEADMTFASAGISRAEALSQVEKEAHRRAREAGASAGSIVTVELEEAALSYLAGDALRVRARAIGDIEESSR
ncbi:MAG: hydantoinase/oxoprolinase family protein [Candidatus Binatus sp.]|uniref:hydantoinase/oxoprolinase family protein n=1 Tax=Candidatus Binatus sp. TaxID=2811406 RepID=UPI002716FA53|nr:hydantoinase/oxoprolinase family protein [Candidatus Binatus sp.]MDO8431638.1 hydantoinase/oxoprolinase family protein [Candidatus Binatus sp.]